MYKSFLSVATNVAIIVVVFLLIIIILSIVGAVYAVRWSKEGKISGIVLSFINIFGLVLIVVCLIFYFDKKNNDLRAKFEEKDELEKKYFQMKIDSLEAEKENALKQLNLSKNDDDKNIKKDGIVE